MGYLSKVRRASWRTSSITGDIQAASKGPGAVARREVRKTVYRHVGRQTRRTLRWLGL